MKTHYGGGRLDDSKLKGESASVVEKEEESSEMKTAMGFFSPFPQRIVWRTSFSFFFRVSSLCRGTTIRICQEWYRFWRLSKREREREDLKNRESVWNLNFWLQEKGLYVKHEMAFLFFHLCERNQFEKQAFLSRSFFCTVSRTLVKNVEISMLDDFRRSL